MFNQLQLLNSIPKVEIKHLCFAFANTLLVADAVFSTHFQLVIKYF